MGEPQVLSLPSDDGECGVFAVIKECFSDEIDLATLCVADATTQSDPAVFATLIGGEATLVVWLNDPYTVQGQDGRQYPYETLGGLEKALHDALEDVYLARVDCHDSERGIETPPSPPLQPPSFAPLVLPLFETGAVQGIAPSPCMLAALRDTVDTYVAYYSAANAVLA